MAHGADHLSFATLADLEQVITAAGPAWVSAALGRTRRDRTCEPMGNLRLTGPPWPSVAQGRGPLLRPKHR